MATPEHLLPTFDPALLKVPALRSILLRHSIPFPSNGKKADLVAAYETSLRPLAPRLLAEYRRVQPSDHGILDGESVAPAFNELDTDSDPDAPPPSLPLPLPKKKKGRPSTRKLVSTKPDPDNDDDGDDGDALELQEAVQPKKPARKSSVPPPDAAHAPAKRRLGSVPPEEKPKRLKPDPSTSSSAEKDRRQSLKYESGGETSFSDYNPFQSGPEDTPEKRRKSTPGAPRRSLHSFKPAGAGPSGSARKSLPATLPSASSAPAAAAAGRWQPDSPEAASSPDVRARLLSPKAGPGPATGIKYMLPQATLHTPVRPPVPSPAKTDPLPSPASIERSRERALDLDDVLNLPEDMELDQLEAELEAEERHHTAKSRDSFTPGHVLEGRRGTPKRAGAGRVSWATSQERNGVAVHGDFVDDANDDNEEEDELALTTPSTKRPASKPALVTRLTKWTLVLLAVSYLLWWREEKVAAGFCDTASPSSNPLTRSRAATHTPSLVLDLPSLPPAFLDALDRTHLRPGCTPCPTHGICRVGAFTGCQKDYVAVPHPLALGGLVPLPPACRADTEKLMAVAVQAAKIARALRAQRGRVVCSGLERARKKSGRDEAWVYGVAAEEIMDGLRKENELSDAPYDEAVLDDISRLAIVDLQNHGEIISTTEQDTLWLASMTADMPLACRARLAALDQVDQHKSQLGSLLALLLTGLWLRSSWRSRRAEKAHVRELVQMALAQLRKQERLHYNDPVVTPHAHVAPSHLRDLVLQAEHSPVRRQRFWTKVEKVVESNANVRAKEVEIDGEPIRAWEWTGLALEDETPAKTESLYPKLQ